MTNTERNTLILGIDIGGTGIKGGLVDIVNGKMITKRHRIPTPKPATPAAVAETVKQIVDFFDWNGPIGFGFPALVQNGIVKTANNIDKTWIETNAIQLFEQKLALPVQIINDADAAGLAEINFGTKNAKNGIVLLLTLGTGIGSALFLNGKLLPNTELGQIYLENNILGEKYASEGVRKRNSMSWEKYGEQLNFYLTQIERLFSPDLIILGGGGSKKYTKIQPFLQLKTPVVPAILGNHAGIIGAAIAAKNLAQSIMRTVKA
ncbi:MAG: polyphosphate--glucose phosphotransferase [Chitinophagales bacterium]